MTEVWRALEPSDATSVATLLAASEEAFGNTPMYSPAATELLIVGPGLALTLAERAVLIETADHWIARVAPDAVGRGLGASILARLRHEVERRPSAPRVQWTPRRDDRATRLLTATGWTSEYVDLQMRIETRTRRGTRPAGVEIHAGTASDQRAVHDLVCRAWDVEPHFDAFVERFVNVPGYDPRLWFLARVGDDLVGCVIGESGADGIGVVRHLDVDPAHRRHGIGAALLGELLLRLDQRGIEHAQLGVHADNASGAPELYRSLGWHVISEHRKWTLDTSVTDGPVRGRAAGVP